MLHVLNGDATRVSLERSTVPGAPTVWADVLYEGRVPGPGTPDEEWRRIRARHHSGGSAAGYEEALAMMRAWDAGLESYVDHEEVVIWCEHDLFDQLLLIRHLEWFGRREPAPAILSLICIDAYPGIEEFMGLGQLRPDQLAELLATRTPVTAAQLELGRRGWAAFIATEPGALEDLARHDRPELPFLAPALRRLLEEYPSTEDGLSRTERRLLELLEGGAVPIAELFSALHRGERRYYITDLSLAEMLDDLAAEPAPAVALRIDEPRPGRLPLGSARLTELGNALIRGDEDRPALHPLDRWIGGVHLHGAKPAWRWDRRREHLVAA